MCERAFPYPDNIMPLLIYRKSIRETPTLAYAKAGARETDYRSKANTIAVKADFAISC